MKRLLVCLLLVGVVGCGNNSDEVLPTQGDNIDPATTRSGLIFDRADHSDGYGKESMTVYFKKMGNQHHGLKTTDGKNPSHFEVAGIDGVWHTADETWFVYGDHIIARSKMVKEPIHVRMTKPNVVNEAGLTAQPFSTR
mgnify:CR=1 FL=1